MGRQQSHQNRSPLASVKTQKRTESGTIAGRLAILLGVFSPWEGIALTYRQFAAELGKPVTPVTIKKWPQRQKFPADVARLIVAKARARGLVGVTLEWVLWGDGPRPQRVPKTAPKRATAEAPPRAVVPKVPAEPHGQFAAQVAAALESDLSHNEFGNWSSVEAQHTVIWALKDLARRLRVLQFDMGKTFELTDEWAGHVGLPVRRADAPAEERADQDA
jgi:hypothetical protein